MKVVFLTNSPDAPCSMFYSNAFSFCDNIVLGDRNVGNYDVVLLMTYDHEYVDYIKHHFPEIKVGLIDPRSASVSASAAKSDFLIVDSIEMEDYWRSAHKPIFRYVEYPIIQYEPVISSRYKVIDKLKVGYHGNTVHLECMSETVTPALESIAKSRDVELVLMHNSLPPSGEESWYPRGVSVKHVKWSLEGYKELASCDIGIVPNNILQNSGTKKFSSSGMPTSFNYKDDDYLIRFKMPSNPGRMIVFGILGVPVVADFYPSAHELLVGCDQGSRRGLVANSADGWEYSISSLTKSPEKRFQMAESLQKHISKFLSPQAQNASLMNFLEFEFGD